MSELTLNAFEASQRLSLPGVAANAPTAFAPNVPPAWRAAYAAAQALANEMLRARWVARQQPSLN